MSSTCSMTYLGCSNIEKQRRTEGDLDDIKYKMNQKLTG